MGRLIDADKLIEYWLTSPMNIGYDDEIEDVNNQPTIEAIPKADYEARLKADMVAMLEDLDLQIDESAAYNLEVAKVQRLIRDKINALRGDNE